MRRLFFIALFLVCASGGSWWYFTARSAGSAADTGIFPPREITHLTATILPKARSSARLEPIRISDMMVPGSASSGVERLVRLPSRYLGGSTKLSSAKGAPRRIETLVKEAKVTLTSQGSQYRLLSGVIALPQNAPPPAGGAGIVGRNAGFAFYDVSKGETGDGTSPKPLGVVYNPATGVLGVVTGGLSVKWTGNGAAESLAQDYQMQTVQTFDQLSVTYYQSTRAQVSDLLQLQEQLKRDQRVVQVNLQILERTLHPE